jgi:hypothetical protein
MKDTGVYGVDEFGGGVWREDVVWILMVPLTFGGVRREIKRFSHALGAVPVCSEGFAQSGKSWWNRIVVISQRVCGGFRGR